MLQEDPIWLPRVPANSGYLVFTHLQDVFLWSRCACKAATSCGLAVPVKQQHVVRGVPANPTLAFKIWEDSSTLFANKS